MPKLHVHKLLFMTSMYQEWRYILSLINYSTLVWYVFYTDGHLPVVIYLCQWNLKCTYKYIIVVLGKFIVTCNLFSDELMLWLFRGVLELCTVHVCIYSYIIVRDYISVCFNSILPSFMIDDGHWSWSFMCYTYIYIYIYIYSSISVFGWNCDVEPSVMHIGHYAC